MPEAFRHANRAGRGFDVAKMLIGASVWSMGLNDYLHSRKDFKAASGSCDATPQNDFRCPAVLKSLEADGKNTAQVPYCHPARAISAPDQLFWPGARVRI